MSNSYTMLSMAVSIRSPKEYEWWNQLCDTNLQFKFFRKNFESYMLEWNNCKEKHCPSVCFDCEADCLPHGLNFEIQEDSKDKKYIWIYAEENGDVEVLVAILQLFLKECRPTGKIGFTWANTCSRPLLNSFDGGGCNITAKGVRWFNCSKVDTSCN